jgi:hypothetical protein
LAITEARIVHPLNIRKSDIFDLLRAAASSRASTRAEAIFASVNLEEALADDRLLAQTLRMFQALCIKFAD